MSKGHRPWYETFFGPDYLQRYVHADTSEEVDATARILHLPKGARILDLACGAGRHSVELAKRGYRVTGYDLSRPLLAEARRAARREGVRLTLVHGDMRELAYVGRFDAVLSLFTSFGYFDRPSEDERVVAGIARALRPRGKLLVERFNRDAMVANLPAQSWRIREDGTVVLTEDTFDALRDRYETRQIVIDRKGTREYVGSVRAYTFAEVKAMLEAHDLHVHRVLGGFDLSAYGSGSRRMLVYAVKGLEPERVRTMW